MKMNPENRNGTFVARAGTLTYYHLINEPKRLSNGKLVTSYWSKAYTEEEIDSIFPPVDDPKPVEAKPDKHVFHVLVSSIEEVAHHPDQARPHLSVMKVAGGRQVVSMKVDGQHRYQVGDFVVFVPHGALVPEYILRNGFWNETENKPAFKGGRVKASKFGSMMSEGILLPLLKEADADGNYTLWIENETNKSLAVHEGSDVAEHLGIKEWK